ncbi:MAG: helix-turn-helix domain-containing protein [Nitrospirae bacterium]|nr:helix-turn-helix domain-containing protein [Nitrospirota bacterium]
MPTEQNLYRLLDVADTATPHEIRQAYELARRTYGGESLATYSLFGAEDRQAVMAQIEEAYRVLSDPERRRSYDARLSAVTAPQGAAPQAAPAPPADAARAEAPHEAPATPETIVIPDVITGRELRRWREARRLSLQTIANLTRINIKYLQYLEEDLHAKLPHTVFIRSYLLQYAKALRLDADRLLNAYLKGMNPGAGA